MPDHRELSGKTENHVEFFPELETSVHRDIGKHLLALKRDSIKEGFNLCVASGYRSYERQEMIWNNKTSGKTSILDDSGDEIDIKKLSAKQLIYAICRWSAIPGTSRHHWGTDVDVYDKNALPSPDYKVQLSPEEVNPKGIFALFHDWLDFRMKKNAAYGFIRPYNQDTGGIYPERWHLSFHEVAAKYQEDYTFDFFCTMLKKADFNLRDVIDIHREDIYSRFICSKKTSD